MDTFFDPYVSDITAFIGLPIQISVAEPDSRFALTIDTTALFNGEFQIPFITVINSLCSKALTTYYQEYSTVSDPFIHRQLLIPYLAFSCLNLATHADQAFMTQLVQLAQATYESAPTQTGLLLVPYEFGLNVSIESLDLEYRPLGQQVPLNTLLQEKSGLHLNDGRSTALVVSRSLEPLGWVFKRQRAIRDVMVDRFMDFDTAIAWMFTYVGLAQPVIDAFVSDIYDDGEGSTIAQNKFYEKLWTILVKSLPTIEENVRSGRLASETSDVLQEVSELVKSRYEDCPERLAAIRNRQQNAINIMYQFQDVIQKQTGALWDGIKTIPAQFVYLDRGRVFWVLDDGLELVCDHGRWHFSHPHVLRYIILAHFLQEHPFPAMQEHLVPTSERMIRVSHHLFRAARDASAQHHGGLLILLPASATTIPEPPQYYESFITNQNGKPLSVADIDLYRFQLLLSLDGAVVVDSHGDVRSFGHMVDIKRSKTDNPITQGARSLAAANASRAGALAIKISEDGDITVFAQGKQVARV